MEQYYSICQISKLLKISPQTLRFYEKEGLFSPKKAANGYRQYTLENIREIQDIIYYRNVDMSLDEIRDIFFHTDAHAWEKILEEKIREEQEKIMRHRSYLNRLQSFYKSITQAEPAKTPTIRPLPGCYILFQSDWPIPEEKFDTYSTELFSPSWTYEIFERSFVVENCLREPSKIIRVIEEDATNNFTFDKKNPPIRLDFPECVSILLPSSSRSAKGLDLSALFHWCSEQNIELESTIFTRYLFNATENNTACYYMEIFCPIAKPKS